MFFFPLRDETIEIDEKQVKIFNIVKHLECFKQVKNVVSYYYNVE